MQREVFEIEPVAHVVGGRVEPTDGHWGGSRCVIRIDHPLFGPDATKGLEAFTHIEVVYRFHLVQGSDLNTSTRRPKDRAYCPEVGIFAHRNTRRVNWLAISRCRLTEVDGLDLHVEDFDAVSGTPVLDIKPWFVEMGPRGVVEQPDWSTRILASYYATPPDQS